MIRRAGLLVASALFSAFAPSAGADEAGAPEADLTTANNFFTRDSLTGDWLRYRTRLEEHGFELGGDEIAEILANPIGGQKQRMTVEGRLELFLNVDLEKAVHWTGASFHANAYQIHGRGLSANAIGNLLTVSNIEAQRSTRLFDLWLQQELFDHAVSIRAGQIAADDEFYVSQYATLFINSTFGWPAILGADLPSGGPAYPLATPGLRIKAALTPALSFAIAAFNGDPANPGPGNAQQRDAGGTNFRLDSDRFLIGEWSYSNNLGPDREGLPGTFKFGAWYHSGRFPDQRDDTTGLSLANPASTGIAASHRGDFGAYFIADQTVWREPGTSDQGLGAFFRIAGAPPDRNLIAFHVDAGISYKGLLPRRDNDTIGLALSLARIGSAQRALARDAETFTGTSRPIPGFESVIEASYQAALTPWWIVQPDVQLVLHPGARLDAAATPSPKPIPNAFVLGLRTAVIF